MRRWFHDRFNRHAWESVSHLHDVEQGAEKFDYELADCRCGAIREAVIVKHYLPSPFPGIKVGYLEVTVNDLPRREDAKVWAKS